MMFTNIIAVMALAAVVVVAHPPAKKNGYSIVTHHIEPKKVHHNEWAKQSSEGGTESSWNHNDGHGKLASSYSSIITGSKNLPELHASQQASSLSLGLKNLPALHKPHKTLAWSAPASGQHQDEQYGHEKDSYPKYQFDYGVKDPHTGDKKKQWETRHGDQVKGAFESTDVKNGAKSKVEYSSNKHTGFLADVNSKLVKPHSQW